MQYVICSDDYEKVVDDILQIIETNNCSNSVKDDLNKYKYKLKNNIWKH